MNTRRSTIGLLSAGVLTILSVPLAANALRPAKVLRIGVLYPGTAQTLFPRMAAFRQGLREMGYVEGQNIAIETRHADGRPERLRELAVELIQRDVNVISASGDLATRMVQETTTTIPVVALTDDRVGAGLVASLARPGGNVTGLASLNDELSGKRLELLKEALPRVARVGLLWDPYTDAGQLRATDAAGRALGTQVQTLEARGADDFESAFLAAQKGRAQAIIVLSSPLLYAHRARIVELAARNRLPAMYYHKDFVVDVGGLMAYGAHLEDLYRRAATYVDKILKGAKPADLPVEQPTRFELVVNVKTAKALGLTIPPSVLVRADQVIQ